jgi:hypothetical protein
MALKAGLSQEEAMAEITCPDPHPKQAQTPMTKKELDDAIVARLYNLYAAGNA